MYTLEDLVNDKELTGIINDYWKDYVKHRNLDIVVKPSIPIIWFGDLVAYKNSDVKVVTVALNPSCNEFNDDRFPHAQKLVACENLSDNNREDLIESYNRYFTINPYQWFRNSYENLFHIFPEKYNSVSYGYDNNAKYTAIHIDYFTSLATKKPWGDKTIPDSERKEIKNVECFEKLKAYLSPDIILFSGKDLIPVLTKGTSPRKSRQLETTGEKKVERISYIVDGKLLIYGTYFAGVPFGGVFVKHAEKNKSQKNVICEMFDDYGDYKLTHGL